MCPAACWIDRTIGQLLLHAVIKVAGRYTNSCVLQAVHCSIAALAQYCSSASCFHFPQLQHAGSSSRSSRDKRQSQAQSHASLSHMQGTPCSQIFMERQEQPLCTAAMQGRDAAGGQLAAPEGMWLERCSSILSMSRMQLFSKSTGRHSNVNSGAGRDCAKFQANCRPSLIGGQLHACTAKRTMSHSPEVQGLAAACYWANEQHADLSMLSRLCFSSEGAKAHQAETVPIWLPTGSMPERAVKPQAIAAIVRTAFAAQ